MNVWLEQTFVHGAWSSSGLPARFKSIAPYRASKILITSIILRRLVCPVCMVLAIGSWLDSQSAVDWCDAPARSLLMISIPCPLLVMASSICRCDSLMSLRRLCRCSNFAAASASALFTVWRLLLLSRRVSLSPLRLSLSPRRFSISRMRSSLWVLVWGS